MDAAHTNRVLETLRRIKDGAEVPSLPLAGRGRLVPVLRSDADDPDAVALLARWREGANPFFPSQFPVTLPGTQRWVVKQLHEVPDRILFWVEAGDGTRVGHVGLYRFDFAGRTCEIDNIVRGEPTAPGIMLAAVAALLDWTFGALATDAAYLRVISDNARAIRLYERCGFREALRVPLVRREDGAVVHWDEVGSDYRGVPERYFVSMRLPAEEWRVVRRRASAA